MGLSVYLYVGGVKTTARSFVEGTRLGVRGKLSAWFGIGVPGALVHVDVHGQTDQGITDVAGWFTCGVTLPSVNVATGTLVKVMAIPVYPLTTETKTLPITIVPFVPVPPPDGDGNGLPPGKSLGDFIEWLEANPVMLGATCLAGFLLVQRLTRREPERELTKKN